MHHPSHSAMLAHHAHAHTGARLAHHAHAGTRLALAGLRQTGFVIPGRNRLGRGNAEPEQQCGSSDQGSVHRGHSKDDPAIQ
jgi:hypothetical protein